MKEQTLKYWVELEEKYRGKWEDPEGADEVAAEFQNLMTAIAPYDCAEFWKDNGVIDRAAAKRISHGVTTYPNLYQKYL